MNAFAEFCRNLIAISVYLRAAYLAPGTYRLLEAVQFATEAHHGVIRKFTNEPYVQHPIRVAQLVLTHSWEAEYSYRLENMVIAALLHDVLEDCPHVTAYDIMSQFGVMVMTLVKELTDPDKSQGNRAARKLLTIEKFKLVSGDAHTIKCADFLDNADSMVLNDLDFGPRWLKEKSELLPVLNRAVPSIHVAAMNELNRLQKVIEERHGLASSTG